jgi:hypothetical protein
MVSDHICHRDIACLDCVMMASIGDNKDRLHTFHCLYSLKPSVILYTFLHSLEDEPWQSVSDFECEHEPKNDPEVSDGERGECL